MTTNTVEQIPWRQFPLDQIASGPLFFYVGAGLSCAAGLVGWHELVHSIAQFRREYEGHLEHEASSADDPLKNATYLREFIDELDPAGRRILSRPSEDTRQFGRTVLLNLLLRHKRADPSAGHSRPLHEGELALHTALWRSGCQGAFTTNYDMLLEEAFALVPPSMRSTSHGHSAGVRTYRYFAQFLPYLLSVPRFILKLHGDVDDIGSMLFDPESAWSEGGSLSGRTGDDLRKAFWTARSFGHVIYLGCGGRDRTFRELHFNLPTQSTKPFRRLFVAPISEVPRIASGFGSGVSDLTFLTFETMDDFSSRHTGNPELGEFLQAISHHRLTRGWTLSGEAIDLWNQLGRGELRANWFTPKWHAPGVRLSGQWRRGSPQVAGTYIWRRRGSLGSRFLAEVKEEAWDGYFLSVRLEGREILWRYNEPWAVNGGPPDEEFVAYEWIGPLADKC